MLNLSRRAGALEDFKVTAGSGKVSLCFGEPDSGFINQIRRRLVHIAVVVEPLAEPGGGLFLVLDELRETDPLRSRIHGPRQSASPQLFAFEGQRNRAGRRGAWIE